MRNIELKARLGDRENAITVCEKLQARAMGEIRQTDTYFNVSAGRLKLREADAGRTELVFYNRADVEGPKGCDYTLESVAPSIKRLLADALGILAVVEKVRTLYLWKNVRIHIDAVAKLGSFIEFEAVLDAELDDADGEAKLKYLIDEFSIRPHEHLAVSYLDLTLAQR